MSHQGGGPGEDPGHAGETMSLSWPGNASGSPRKSWRKCLGKKLLDQSWPFFVEFARFLHACLHFLLQCKDIKVQFIGELSWRCEYDWRVHVRLTSSPTPTVLVSKIRSFVHPKNRNQQKSVIVKQSPETASVQPGGSVTLQCSLLSKNKENRVQCPGEHSVYWFRAGSGGFHPGVIYTHRNSSDEEEERSCVYSLSKTIQNSSDTGTYYCAVATCGEILFGEGTTVETRTVCDSGSELDPVVLVLGVLLACCVTVIGVLIFYLHQRKACEHCKGAMSVSHHLRHEKSTVDESNNLNGEEEAMNYAALDFNARKVKRGKKKSEMPQECVYSAVRADYHNQQHPSL
ncbi:hypothetical protein L3Q82_020348 [Scortum barcoo]|uniref:Uncharacterized protein n=1 Tax=Scortum barcoo TaxID=214431 RepID=A0ACB8V7J6_9TELE|nr:hypothetical protein L3Q82_020348 [Scortum barcoo]